MLLVVVRRGEQVLGEERSTLGRAEDPRGGLARFPDHGPSGELQTIAHDNVSLFGVRASVMSKDSGEGDAINWWRRRPLPSDLRADQCRCQA
jgi:hypothetical protein